MYLSRFLTSDSIEEGQSVCKHTLAAARQFVPHHCVYVFAECFHALGLGAANEHAGVAASDPLWIDTYSSRMQGTLVLIKWRTVQ